LVNIKTQILENGNTVWNICWRCVTQNVIFIYYVIET